MVIEVVFRPTTVSLSPARLTAVASVVGNTNSTALIVLGGCGLASAFFLRILYCSQIRSGVGQFRPKPPY